MRRKIDIEAVILSLVLIGMGFIADSFAVAVIRDGRRSDYYYDKPDILLELIGVGMLILFSGLILWGFHALWKNQDSKEEVEQKQ